MKKTYPKLTKQPKMWRVIDKRIIIHNKHWKFHIGFVIIVVSFVSLVWLWRGYWPKMLCPRSRYVICFCPFHFHRDAIKRLEYHVASVPPTKLLTPEFGMAITNPRWDWDGKFFFYFSSLFSFLDIFYQIF